MSPSCANRFACLSALQARCSVYPGRPWNSDGSGVWRPRRPNRLTSARRRTSVMTMTTEAFPALASCTPEQFGAWVSPHLRAMTLLAARLSSEADRDDVVQEALSRAWRKRAQFDPRRGTPSAWLLAITADQARRMRSRGRSHIGLIQGAVRPIDDELDLAWAIARLSARQRLAVNCYYFVGLSITETAAVMGCAPGTVKSTLSDARLRLRPLLEMPHGPA